MSDSQAGDGLMPDRVIPGYGAYSIPSLESIGGEMAVLASTGDPDGIDLRSASNQDARESSSVPQVGMPAKQGWFRRP